MDSQAIGRSCGLLLLATTAALAGCRAHAPPQPRPCGSDRDCKLDRICSDGACVWPDRPLAPSGPADQQGAPPAPETVESQAPPAALATLAQAMFRGDAQHGGRSPYVLPARKPELVWKYRTGGPVYSSPAIVADGSVAVGSHDRMLHVVGPTGDKRFTFATGDLIFGSPAVDAAGRLYIGSDDDHLYAFDLATQRMLWRLRLGACRESRGVGPEASRCDVQGGPTLGPDGTIFVGSDGVYAITPSGTIAWHFQTPARVPVAPALLADGTVIAGGLDHTLYAIAPDGEKRWDFKASADIESSAAIGSDGTIYFGSDDHKVYALSPTGELLWAFNTGGDVRASPALGRDGNVLVGAFDGLFYAIDASGTLEWTFRTGDRIVSSALVDANGAILFGSQDDRLYALESDGSLRWSLELEGDIDSSPVLGPDGMIFVGSDDGHLYAYRGN